MLDVIKSAIPGPLKRELYSVKQKTYDQWYKKRLFKKMQIKHTELIGQIKGKQKIRVVFLAIHESVWKVDPVFKKMLEDPFFEPEILICPYTVYGEERMLEDMQQAYNYFISKGYPVRKAREEDGSWLKLSDIKPDIVFFTNPHNLTRKEYYEDAYLNYLSCYVPYHHEVGSYGNNIDQYNQAFHNAMWFIFSSNQSSYNLFKTASAGKGTNVKVTGYPAMEELLGKINENQYEDVWKTHDGKLRIIWAPHHTIDSPELPYSNFLEYAEKFQKFALDNYENIIWSFKPHPILRSKLYNHKNWGKQKTDNYYNFWHNQNFTQLDEGEYFDLFASSDIMIHDSGSFLAEYLYLRKPVLYLLSDSNQSKYYSEFGQEALNACEVANSFDDIERFIQKVLSGDLAISSNHSLFYNSNLITYFKDVIPSDLIVNLIKEKLV